MHHSPSTLIPFTPHAPLCLPPPPSCPVCPQAGSQWVTNPAQARIQLVGASRAAGEQLGAALTQFSSNYNFGLVPSLNLPTITFPALGDVRLVRMGKGGLVAGAGVLIRTPSAFKGHKSDSGLGGLGACCFVNLVWSTPSHVAAPVVQPPTLWEALGVNPWRASCRRLRAPKS